MIFLSTTHPPSANPDSLSCTDTITKFCAQYPGFPGYVLFQPDKPGSAGDGWGYPGGVYGPDWKGACKAALAKGGVLWPRIGGCKTVYDVPQTDGPIATLMDRFRPSKAILCDYGSGGDARAVSDRYQRIITDNLQVFAPEANARREWIVPAENVWIVAEWFHWDVPIPNAMSDADSDRWGLHEWLAANPDTKAIVEITTETRKKLGFSPTVNNPNPCPDWDSAKLDIAETFHKSDPKRVIVVVRPSGKWTTLQTNRLRGLNA